MTQMSAGRRQRRRLAQMFQEAFAPRIAPERQGEALQALLTQFDGESIGAITRAEFVIRCKHTMKPFLNGEADGRERGAHGLRRVPGGAGAGESHAVDDLRGPVARLVDVCTLTEEEEADGLRMALARLDDGIGHLHIVDDGMTVKDPGIEDILQDLTAARYDLGRLLGIDTERTSAPVKEEKP